MFPDGNWDPNVFVTREYGSSWIDTTPLKVLIPKWHDDAKASPRHSRGRIVRSLRALDRARYFVSNFCASGGPDGPAPVWPVDPQICLSLMILGETLTIALRDIQRAVDFQPPGWSNPDHSSLGWGYSEYVLGKLGEDRRWCKRTIAMLRGLMQNNTIGVMYALMVDAPSDSDTPHIGCSATVCKVEEDLKARWTKPKAIQNVPNGAPANGTEANSKHKRGQRGGKSRKGGKGGSGKPQRPPMQARPDQEVEKEESSNYDLYHHPEFCEMETCTSMGINTRDLESIVIEEGIPLLFYERGSNKLRMQKYSMDRLRQTSYVVFSHVWSAGFGNPDCNRMNRCVLDYFQALFAKLPEASPSETPFWIDTITIPVKRKGDSQNAQAIKKGIKSMHEIYFYAQYTIVLDLSLMRTPRSKEQFLDLAMRITVSDWMRRLWTLQEAYLSRQIWFALRKNDLFALDRLEVLYKQTGGSIYNSLPSTCRAYHKGILGDDRNRMIRDGAHTPDLRIDSNFVSQVWKAVQWRTTSFSQHEPLALATLFGLNTDPFADASNTTSDDGYTQAKCDELMRKLLDELGSLRGKSCAIPPGMIFLAGPYLNIAGYCWAPRSWLSASQTDPPDPLSVKFKYADARLNSEGLEVQFPGFRIYDMNVRATDLKMEDKQKISFSVDSNLIEWYVLEEADTNWFFKKSFRLAESEELAVIVPRLPLLNPKEIALLVNVKRESANILYANVLHRVWISRESDADALRTLQADFNAQTGSGAPRCGAILPNNQQWCVDRALRPSEAPRAGGSAVRSRAGSRRSIGTGDSPQSHQFFKSQKQNAHLRGDMTRRQSQSKSRTLTKRLFDTVESVGRGIRAMTFGPVATPGTRQTDGGG